MSRARTQAMDTIMQDNKVRVSRVRDGHQSVLAW